MDLIVICDMLYRSMCLFLWIFEWKKQNQFTPVCFLFFPIFFFFIFEKWSCRLATYGCLIWMNSTFFFFFLSSVCIHYSTAFNKQWNAMYDAKERGRETTARLNNTKLTWRDPVSCVWCILHRNTWSHSFKRRLSIHYWICQTFSYWTNETKTKCFS